MKTMMLIVALAGLLVAGCNEEQMAKVTPSVWLLSGANVQDAESQNEIEDSLEYIGRVGLQLDQTEFGLTSDWWMGGEPRQSYGVYAIQFLPIDPNGLLGKPYVSAQATLDVEEESGGMYGFGTGTLWPMQGFEMVAEVQARQYDDNLADKFSGNDEVKGFVGLRIGF